MEKTTISSNEINYTFNYESLRDLAGSSDKFSMNGYYLYFLPLAVRVLVKNYHFGIADGATADENIDYLKKIIVARCVAENINHNTIERAMNGDPYAMLKIYETIFIDDPALENHGIGKLLLEVCNSFYNSKRFQAELWLNKNCDSDEINATLAKTLDSLHYEENINTDIFNMM
jgi:hypothetical protein